MGVFSFFLEVPSPLARASGSFVHLDTVTLLDPERSGLTSTANVSYSRGCLGKETSTVEFNPYKTIDIEKRALFAATSYELHLIKAISEVKSRDCVNGEINPCSTCMHSSQHFCQIQSNPTQQPTLNAIYLPQVALPPSPAHTQPKPNKAHINAIHSIHISIPNPRRNSPRS